MKTFVLTLIILTSVGCNFKRMKGGNDLTPQEQGQIEINAMTISYSKIERQILAPSCVGCHSGKHEPSLTNYEEVKSALKDIERVVIFEQSMPKKKPLSAPLQSLLAAWISVGAPEQALQSETPSASPSPSPAPTLPPISRPVSFATLKSRVLEPNCISCHAQGNKEGNTSMEDYAAVKSVVELLLPLTTGKMGTETIPEDQRMPPPQSPPLTAEQLSILQMWVDDGALP